LVGRNDAGASSETRQAAPDLEKSAANAANPDIHIEIIVAGSADQPYHLAREGMTLPSAVRERIRKSNTASSDLRQNPNGATHEAVVEPN
jgi:hypothetical protein